MSFYRISFSSLLFLLLLLGAVVIGRRVLRAGQAIPLQALFSNADGNPCAMPCMFGVRPGMPHTDQVISALSTHPLITVLQPQPGSVPTDEFISIRERGISSFVRMMGDQVSTITFNMYVHDGMVVPPEQKITNAASAATLGDAILLWGTPELVTILQDRVAKEMYVSLCYKAQGFCVGFIGKRALRIYPALSFYSFYTNSSEQMSALLANMESHGAGSRWMGLTTLERYRHDG
ncbi:MAG: hypothetical protein KF726_11355 [Anaerolineae bacterium]|nr:hypothetical protein [Anaerolineae bacterium]